MSEDMVQEAVEVTKEAVEKLDPATTSAILRNVSGGFVALTLSMVTGSIALNKFRDAYRGRELMVQAAAALDEAP